MLIADIISVLEDFAPLPLQEDFDNSGLQVGDKSAECSGVLLCVDVTPAIIDEAIEKGCNLVVSHHPLLFKGLKRITGATLVERTILKAISANIVIYSCHTSIDNAFNGVSWKMAELLGLTDVETLSRQKNKMLKLSVMVPTNHLEAVREALFGAGAGALGNYDSCSFSAKGEGTFRALDGANPYVGNMHELHYEQEVRLDVILPVWLKRRVEHALCGAHPYEEPAYEFIALENDSPYTGLGTVGQYETPISPCELIEKVKKAFNSPITRCSAFDEKLMIKKVAMCSGSGSSFIRDAIATGAQVFITSDTRYHDFIDYANDILIVDIGHYESEQCTKDIFYHVITEKFPNFAVYYSDKEQNPINYL